MMTCISVQKYTATVNARVGITERVQTRLQNEEKSDTFRSLNYSSDRHT